MLNFFKRFKALVGDPPLLVGEILSHEDGVALIQEPSGALITARSSITSGRVYFRNGVVESEAPDIDYGEDEV